MNEMSKKNVITNARTINKMRCIVGLILCSIVIVLTMVAFTLNVIKFFDDGTSEPGIGTLRMYTTLSNILAALAASICVPFQIDGLRKNKYKLPRWVVELMYVGTVGVFLTFTVASTAISMASGFVVSMFGKSNLFMHTLNPIFITLLFVVAIPDAHIKFNRSFLALIPTVIYLILYFIFVFVTHIWKDHYHVSDYLPWPVALVLVLSIAYGLAVLLMFLHNLNNKHVLKNIEKYYKESPDYEFEKITQAIEKLAKQESVYYSEGDDISIPVDVIGLLSERYKATSLPLDILYDIYLENYLLNIHPKQEEKENKE